MVLTDISTLCFLTNAHLYYASYYISLVWVISSRLSYISQPNLSKKNKKKLRPPRECASHCAPNHANEMLENFRSLSRNPWDFARFPLRIFIFSFKTPCDDSVLDLRVTTVAEIPTLRSLHFCTLLVRASPTLFVYYLIQEF